MGDPVGTVLLVGAGRMGQALLEGWARAQAFDFSSLLIRTPSPKPGVDLAVARGATADPSEEALRSARTVVLCVKPQRWREVAAELAGRLDASAVIVSVLVGVRADDISRGFSGLPVARVLPTTGVARAAGVSALFAPEPRSAAAARRLFEPVSAVVELPEEAMMDAAGAVSASGAAYVYAFAQALERAGRAQGLPDEAAAALAKATLATASAHLAESGASANALIDQVASPGGTTRAALAVLQGPNGLDPLLSAAVAAAVRRARELAG